MGIMDLCRWYAARCSSARWGLSGGLSGEFKVVCLDGNGVGLGVNPLPSMRCWPVWLVLCPKLDYFLIGMCLLRPRVVTSFFDWLLETNTVIL